MALQQVFGLAQDDAIVLMAWVGRLVQQKGIDLVIDKFRGLAGPQGLPEDIIAAWETAIPLLLEDPEFKKFYQESSLVPAFMPHDEYVEFINEFAEEQKAFMQEYGITEE